MTDDDYIDLDLVPGLGDFGTRPGTPFVIAPPRTYPTSRTMTARGQIIDINWWLLYLLEQYEATKKTARWRRPRMKDRARRRRLGYTRTGRRR